jgi:prefoldin subunit 5
MFNPSKVIIIGVLLSCVTGIYAAEEADPAMAVLKRMREQLRTVMLQQQKTEADRAALAAEKADLEAKNADLTKKYEKLVKDTAAERTANEKTIANLK